MSKVCAPILAIVAWVCLAAAQAQAQLKAPLEGIVTTNEPAAGESKLDSLPHVEIEALNEVEYNTTNGFFSATNNVLVRYLTPNKASNVVLTADRVWGNDQTHDIYAEGSVRLQQENMTWTGDKLHYNYETKQMDGEDFRTGKLPFFATGETMQGQGPIGTNTNNIYTAQYGMMTADDYSNPLITVRAKRMIIVPGDYMEAHNATMYVAGVPTFYFPYYRRSLKKDPNSFSFLPGYRSIFGPYLLSSYNWSLNDYLSGSVHADYRESRGPGGGPDVNANLGQFGQAHFKYYYTYDHDPGTNLVTGVPLPASRERIYFSYDASPMTNLTIMSQVAYLSDPYVTHDFFESQYQKDVEPNTFFDVNKFWNNWSLDGTAQPRVDPFYETVERMPELRLTGYRMQIFDTPLFYESQSSMGYYERKFANTNMPLMSDFSGDRADTFHQITLPETFFGWLNVTPRVGGRYTYYGADNGPGGTNSTENREVFNTGAEVSFKASRVWSDSQNHFWDVNGLRHIIEPSIDYVYVPAPNVAPSQLPQYDYVPTNSLQLLPLEFPDFNSIDSIDHEDAIRFGLNNRLQTKRQGETEDLVNWQVYMDWRLRPRSDETTFSDIYSDFTLKPRTWLTFNSQTRFDVSHDRFNLSQNRVTFSPNSTWSWTVGHFYVRDTLYGDGDSLITSTFFYRVNENWGLRVAHFFDTQTGTLEEQDYTIYRDLRSWTAALTFRELNSLTSGRDYGVAFTMSLKAFPRFGLGSDTVNAASLVGY